MATLRPRPATAEDAPLIYAVVNEAYQVERGSTGVAFKDADRFGSVSEVVPSDFMVLEEAGAEGAPPALVGCARVVLLPDDDTCCFMVGSTVPPDAEAARLGAKHTRGGVPHATFGPFTVRVSRQGQGIAPTLLALVEARARELGAAAVEIVVANWRTDVHAFYGKRGYRYVYTAPYRRPGIIRPTALYILRKALV